MDFIIRRYPGHVSEPPYTVDVDRLAGKKHKRAGFTKSRNIDQVRRKAKLAKKAKQKRRKK